MKLTQSQSNTIQVLKGLAIIAVVFIHNTPGGLPQVFVRPFLNFAVGLFLFLSGYLSDANHWNPRKRIMKVIIPYIIWTFIYICLRCVGNLSAIPKEFVLNLITGGGAAIMYYIFVYCEFTLLIPIIDKVAKSKYKYLPFAIAPIEIIFMRLIPMLVGYEIHPYIRIVMVVSCLGWFTYFYLGYLLGNKLIEMKAKWQTLLVIWSLTILIQFAEGYFYYSLGEGNCGTQLKLSSILSGAIFMLFVDYCLSKDISIKSILLLWLGNLSFGIYFCHLAIMSCMNHIPQYQDFCIFPINGIIALILSFLAIVIGRRILGKYAKYLAF